MKVLSAAEVRAIVSRRLTDPAAIEEAVRFHTDAAFRESLPCSECGAVGGCTHFPKVAVMRGR